MLLSQTTKSSTKVMRFQAVEYKLVVRSVSIMTLALRISKKERSNIIPLIGIPKKYQFEIDQPKCIVTISKPNPKNVPTNAINQRIRPLEIHIFVSSRRQKISEFNPYNGKEDSKSTKMIYY